MSVPCKDISVKQNSNGNLYIWIVTIEHQFKTLTFQSGKTEEEGKVTH